MPLKFAAIFYILLLSCSVAFGAKPPIVKWTAKNCFDKKLIIENKGQYLLPGYSDLNKILFGARYNGLQYYFTNHSIWVGHYKAIKHADIASGDAPDQDDKDSSYELSEDFHEINFSQSNASAKLIGDSEVSLYYNFILADGSQVKAHAYKSITYKNLYPGIDMRFYFPENKQGFKYVFIVHAGANASQIKITCPLGNTPELTHEGNIITSSPFGDFIDHAPITTQSEKEVPSNFILDNGDVKFQIGDYDRNRELIIDPWVSTPGFSGMDDVYDVDWDYAGNVYAYGGSDPWQVTKFDNSGTQLWITTPTFKGTSSNYGDFAVDRKSQSIYVTQGFQGSYGAGIAKLDPSGAQISTFNGSTSVYELWRIGFSPCSNQPVIAAGDPKSTVQAAYLDTTMATITPVNVINASQPFHDMWGLTFDHFGNCFMATARSLNTSDSATADNIILKMPSPTLLPVTWKTVNTGYLFTEVTSVQYAKGSFNNVPNGFNGLTASDKYVYSYDSYSLKQWDIGTGAYVKTKVINGPGKINMYYAGLAADECDDIFVGNVSTIDQYDVGLNLVASTSEPDTIFDLMYGRNSMLYVAGAGFVQAIQEPSALCNIINYTNAITNAGCSLPGSVTITLSGGNPPYKVSWNTVPQQNGVTAINLSPGTYIATISDTGCDPHTVYDTVLIKNNGSASIKVNSPVSICSGDSVILTVTGASTYAWSPSTGLSSTIDSIVIAKPISTTTYTIIGIVDSTCSDTIQAIVNVNPLPIINIKPLNPVVCNNTGILLTASGALTYSWSPNSGLSNNTGDTVTANPATNTLYTVNGTDAFGCSDSAQVLVTLGLPPVAAFDTLSTLLCQSEQVQFTNKTVGAIKYLWKFGDGSGDTATNPVHTYNYSLTGSDTVTLFATSASGCTDTLSEILKLNSSPNSISRANAFTPNGDGVNDILLPHTECSGVSGYILRIYSRWGELLFETNQPSVGWDGTYKAQQEPVDVYVYYLEFTCSSCNYFYKGNITLLR